MGTIARLDEQKVTLRVADDVKMEFVKSAIVSVVTEGPQK
jgi:preprotein translocase subunit YajC